MIKQSGQILVLAIIVVAFVLINTLVIISGATLYSQNSNYSLESTQATDLAEAGINKALASLNKTGGSYNGESETFLGSGSYSVTITTKDAGTKIIESTGYIPSKEKPKIKKTIKTSAGKGEGISFLYGMLVGEGGLEMETGNIITGAGTNTGSLYSNGSVKINGSGNQVTGDLWVAGGTEVVPDQENDCDGVNCTEFIFGKNVSGQERLDIAQSFKPTKEAHLNKIQIKLKKYNNPSDATVKIVTDDNGKPDKNGVLATGALFSNLATDNFGWIEITFNSSPNLNADTLYWILIDTTINSTNYWFWQNDLAQNYIPGSPEWSPNWSTGNPVWSNITGDLSFKVYLGDVISTIEGNNGLIIGSDAHANTIRNAIIQKDAYYQTEQNITVRGQSHPNSADPPPMTMPISDSNITKWRADAVDLGGIIYASNLTQCVATLGPGKIEASLDYSDINNCTVIIKTPIWITGDLRVKNDNIFRLDPSYGANSGVIIVDGQIIFERNNNQFLGSGTAGSYLMLLSTFNSVSHPGLLAIDIKNGGNTGVLYASLGAVNIENGNSFKEITAWKLELKNNITISYETGLANTFFTSGPGGSFSLMKGTYQLK